MRKLLKENGEIERRYGIKYKTIKNNKMNIQSFSFSTPAGYKWLLRQGLINFEINSPLLPWYYLKKEDTFFTNKHWPETPSKYTLFVFTRRQDNDDLACFKVENNIAKEIVLIHGWTSEGYSIVHIYATFWDWLKSVIDDMALIVEMENEDQ